ncbi:MAG: hypothetical protein HC806_01585, partial [Anaerolineae bacterium]|nr:hypothetical protein [Anaerolineae bacterium]
GAWRTPPLFRWLGEAGSVPEMDLRRSFNMGIGLILAVAPGDVPAVQRALLDVGEANSLVIGEVEAGEQEKCGKECKPKGSFGGGGSQENDDEKDEEKMAEWVFQA